MRLVAVGYFKFLSSSFQLCPIGFHYGLALGPLGAGQGQEANPLALAYRRDDTEATSEVDMIGCNFLTLNTNLNCAPSQDWI